MGNRTCWDIEVTYRMPERRPVLPALDLLGRKALALG